MRKLSIKLNVFYVIIPLFVIGCGSSSFYSFDSTGSSANTDLATGTASGSTPGGSIGSDDATSRRKDVSINCDTEGQSTFAVFANEEAGDNSFDIAGDICLDPLEQDPRYLFIVDVSGSMEEHFDNNLGTEVAGSDPFVNNSCGRYEAIQSILDKSRTKTGELIGKAALVLFSAGINENSIDFVGIDEFQKQLTPERICLGLESTNYETAFNEAESLFQGEESSLKLAYFISDGLPTVVNNPFANLSQTFINNISIQAGQSFVASDDSIQLFQVFLGNREAEGLSILEEIAGNTAESNIRKAANASDLAQALSDFSFIDLKKENFTIRIDEINEPIGLEVLDPIENGSIPRWYWQTESLSLPSGITQFQFELSLSHPMVRPFSQTFTVNLNTIK
ncbi:MAG: VWA domain-containing protein [Oligoflexales bacterium]|nr:VWA domain-containing protein [Oligoflexales bacterium]